MSQYYTLPALLQKPSATSKAKEHSARLAERINLWNTGNVFEIVKEYRTIHRKLTSNKPKSNVDTSRIFAKLMFEGKINAALKFITESNDHGLLPTTLETVAQLKLKYPEPAPIGENTLLEGPLEKVSSGYFDSIDELTIKKASKMTKGAAGPSHFDSDQYI